MENNLPSILGGMAQGFTDFGKGLFDMFGTGGASVLDLIESAKTGNVTNRRQDDFRKWLYQTDSTKDAAAKGLGTALNGVQTVVDYIPGVNAITQSPLGNAAQGALGGLADELKTYGEDYDLGRAGKRAAISAAGAAASGGLADALKGSSNALLSSNAVRGLARGATGGAITGGGYAAIDGGDVLEAAKQGAGMGALIGGATGAFQDFAPRKSTYNAAMTDEQRQARIANAQKQIDDIGAVSRFSNNPDDIAKRARINELQDAVKAYQSGYDTVQDYNDALAARRANRRQSTTATTGTQQAQDYMMAHRPTQSGAYGYDITAGGEDAMMPADAYNNLSRYTGFTEPKYLDETVAQLNAARNNPDAEITIYRATPGDVINDGDWITLSRAYADTHNDTELGGKGNVLEQRVPARDIQFAGDDLMEWGYFPQKNSLETTLADADMAVNNPRYLIDENGNPRTFYHGSPDKNITEFDINQAGKNTSSGEHALYFTDSPQVADDFSYERLPGDSMFVENKGAKGRVYPVNLEMNNPLDLDNLTDAQIRELWEYASPLGQLDGQEKFIRNLTDWRDNAHNAQLTKGYLDLDKLRGSQYDGFMARMYPNQDNQAREYAVFDNSKVKMLEDVLAKDDMAVNSPKLTPEQEAYFKDSVIRDENGNLMPLYHGSNSKFTVFDSSKGGQSNKTAKVGHWFTPSKEGAEKWAGRAWWGDNDPTVYETYLNIKKPMIYEAIDNSAQIDKLKTQLRQVEDRLNSTYRGSQEYYDAYKEYNNIANEIDNLSYTDPYEQFRSHIYAMEGKTPSQANVGGVGMAMNDEDAAVQKYVDMLKGEGYDGIIIKGTGYDQNVMGGSNDQYVVFDSNQIKDINNLAPTDSPNIMASRMAPDELDLGRALADQDLLVNNAKIAPGQLGLFDDMPTQTPKTGTRQTSLFDQPDNPYLDYYGADIDTTPLTPEAPANPYAPVDGQVTQAMRDRASEIIDNLALKRQIPDNELFNRIDPATLPKGQQKIGEFLDQAYAKGLTNVDIADMMRETVSSEFDKRLGKTPNKEKLISFIFGNADETAKKEMMDKELGLYIAPETVSEGTLSSMAKHKISSEIYGDNLSALTAGNRTLRGGYTGALDSVLSERLGIAPGNTYKKTGEYDTGGSYGRYQEYTFNPNKNNIMVKTALNNEDAVNTMAHERLHSFQTEAKKLYDKDRYSPEVKDAYDELAKDLKDAKAYRTGKEIKERYGSDVAYWRHHDEQEARMLQQYLDAKGYTGSNHHNERRYLGLEYDDAKITPAFDKFFDKLRDLSKRGVALPALAALFGGGAYMASQENDKEKEVK